MSETPFTLPEGATATMREVLGGDQCRVTMPNGYGASIICHSGSYGGDEGLWELAVLGHDGHLTYDTPITSGFVGWLTEAKVSELLAQIAALP